MQDGRFVSIGWKDYVPDLSALVAANQADAKNQIREWLVPAWTSDPGLATRRAGEIWNFASKIGEGDLVLAVEGQTVRGVGKVSGPYEYDASIDFPHKRAVDWLLLEDWQLPANEGPRTAVFEVGKNPDNLLAIEQNLFRGGARTVREKQASPGTEEPDALHKLDKLGTRIESILRRKGQVILYGPPGTGKTYHARRVAGELAARHNFGKSYSDLTAAERDALESETGSVRLCTFHPGYGYEDFVEGLRPKTIDGSMAFEPRNGIFKDLCEAARTAPDRHFFLIIDEINRGDVPRIFGELITVIELDKRSIPIILPVTHQPFSVPANLFIVGTMNTADRSISLLDAALRRRFGFVELMPSGAELGSKIIGELPLGRWLDALNARLRKHLKRDARNLQIGHAYLMSITSVPEFSRVLRDEIVPLLEEYCYEDFATLGEILNPSIIDAENARVKEDIFDSSRETELIQSLFFEEMADVDQAREYENGSGELEAPEGAHEHDASSEAAS